MLKGFRDFVMRGNVADLAVAVIIGAAFGQVVNSLVADVLMPLVGAVGGAPDFSAIKLGPVALGKFVNTVVNFLIVSAAIYLIVVVPMQKLQAALAKKKAEEEAATEPQVAEDVKLLWEILEVLRSN
jgi:large conductance mechanosensitive channel